MSTGQLASLARELLDIRNQLSSLSMPSLAYSSIEGGAIEGYDPATDQLSVIIGEQHDGSWLANPVSGPVPPTPSVPIVQPTTGGLLVGWDGFWADSVMPPVDFARVEVHVGTATGFDTAVADHLVGTIETPRGASIFVPLPNYDQHVVAFVARSLSGKASAKSLEALGTPLRVDASDLAVDLTLVAGSAIYAQPTAPTTATQSNLKAGDFWYDTDDGNRGYRYNGTTWVEVTDTRIKAALDAALAAQTAADGKIRTYVQATAPTGAGVGDLWLDTANSNRLNRWNGSAWVLYQLGNLAISSISASRIDTGVLLTDVTVSGRITTALSGRRVEFNGSGFRKISSTGQVVVDIGGNDDLANITGGIITGGVVRTATTGNRIELSTAGFRSIRSDGSIPFQVSIPGPADPEGANPAVTIGQDTAFLLNGGSESALMVKNNTKRVLTFRSTTAGIGTGAGIDLHERGSDAGIPGGLDADGDRYSWSLRFYAGGKFALKLLDNGNAIFSDGIQSSRQRPVSREAGDLTGPRRVNTYSPIDNWGILTFRAPPSGCALISMSIALRSSSFETYAFGGIEVREGSTQGAGTVVVPATGLALNSNPGWVRSFGQRLVTGLIPGDLYHCRPMFAAGNVLGGDVYASGTTMTATPLL